MGITDRVAELSAKLAQQRASIETEEATKNAFVMPFIGRVLGYDVFNPSEVIPEFTADVGTKKGEKIDYALVHGGEVQMLIEAKKVTEPLRLEHASQLYRYFSVTNARVAVLTNGQVWEFYTDLDQPNVMDAKPFLVLDLAAVDRTLLPELAKLTRESFDLDSVISAAGELKYIGAIKRILAAEFKEPSEEWVRYLAVRVYSGKKFTTQAREQFAPLVEKAAHQFLTEQVNDRLKTALGPEAVVEPAVAAEPAAARVAEPTVADPSSSAVGEEVVTTEDELEGYRIVRAIVCSEVPAGRVVARDAKTYFGVLLDDNNRKPIARLWFNRSQHYLGVFDENKTETRMPINDVTDIYGHADQLRKTVAGYLARTT
ncbi:type I restriction enzyme HsdR N-terminal domain-containing protein [Actinomycetospora endophytica]|uniref:Type I restriction enzyme HsdR N-terminal domain-containing protein n=1 Tax=Actinomycetospora endophytica TaxID=2291215 RepID=A0ABS8P5R6_9PSEU|nr:type I restriction endonuclease [Actinomycetospora endophytica]MCD2193600.1 type I restriction enzyme HsdR N-terminal domain-containing protein [Actinomycetospora endophytica]